MKKDRHYAIRYILIPETVVENNVEDVLLLFAGHNFGPASENITKAVDGFDDVLQELDNMLVPLDKVS